MIRNVLGKSVTKSTVISLPGHDRDGEVTAEDMASVALALKSSQGREDEEAERYVERLRNQVAAEERRFTVGWLYNASGGAITLVEGRDWEGCLFSWSPYPVRIENGQWGVFVHKQVYSGSCAAVLYEGFNSDRQTCYWCVAWKNDGRSTQVCVKIMLEEDWFEDAWNLVDRAWKLCGSQNTTKREGWSSVISATPPPQVVFEALLTMEHL